MALLTLHRMHPAHNRMAFFAGMIFASALSLAGQNAGELDLNTAIITEPKVRIIEGSGAGGGVGGSGSGAEPIKLIVLASDLSGCRAGQINLSIQIANISGKQLILPWNTDGAAVVNSERVENLSFRNLSITVFAFRERGMRAREQFGTAQLFGGDSTKGSERLLEPNSTATLRNIRVAGPVDALCRGEFAVAATLSTNRLTKMEGGFALHSRPVWRVESQ